MIWVAHLTVNGTGIVLPKWRTDQKKALTNIKKAYIIECPWSNPWMMIIMILMRKIMMKLIQRLYNANKEHTNGI